MLCQTCDKRPTCKTLCAPAEEYVNQDDRPEAWRHIRCSPRIEELAAPLSYPEGVSTTEGILRDFFCTRLTFSKIADKRNVSRQYVHKVIRHYQAIIIVAIKKVVAPPYIVYGAGKDTPRVSSEERSDEPSPSPGSNRR